MTSIYTAIATMLNVAKPYKKHKLIFSILLLLFQLQVAAVPVISSFMPTSAPVGSVVTISGSSFSNIASENIVNFGSVAAKVLSASDQSLTVKVPKGATYCPISVTVNGLTAYSVLPFLPTFNAGSSSLSSNTFWPSETLLQTTAPIFTTTADFDSDGTPEIAIVDNGNTSPTLNIYRNTSVDGNISLGAKIVLTSGIFFNPNNPNCVVVADIDGDGKQDIIASKTETAVWVYRNTSTSGNISFDAGHAFGVASGLWQTGTVNVADLNNDGKPDLLTGYGGFSFFSLLVNNSVPGTVSFLEKKVYYGYSNAVFEVTPGNFDGDGKVDLLLSGQAEIIGRPRITYSKIPILKNITFSDSVSFENIGDVTFTDILIYKINTGDFDGDGKLDWAATYSDNIHVLRNTSTDANISFAPSVDYFTGTTYVTPMNISFADVDGDAKPDLAINRTDSVYVYKNNSTDQSISFGPPNTYVSNGIGFTAIADVDLDGKPDIIATNTDGNSVSVLRNKTIWSGLVPICAGADASLTTSLTGQTIQWQLSTDSGANFTNITDNQFYEGATTNKLLLKGIPSIFYGYKYRCVSAIDTSDTYTLKFVNKWIGTTDNDWANPANWSCGTIPDSSTDVEVGSGSVTVNANYSCRSLTINSGASVTVSSGSHLTITH